MEELVVSAHEFESFSKWYRYREPVVSGCVQGVSSTRNIHLPVNTLKIDKSFIDRMFNDTTQNSIIKNIIDMAHTMKMVVVAEGVEKSDQVSFLAQTHCDYIQGYYFGRPEPPATAIQLLKN